MADEDEYEILPHKEIEDLKNELDALKKGPTPESRNQMQKLNDSINSLLGLFKEASSQMNLEEEEANLVSQKLIPLEEKMDQILDQNQKIAEGIVALADLVKDMRDRMKNDQKQMPRFRTGMPQDNSPIPPRPDFGQMPPRPDFRQIPPMGGNQMPPLPQLPPRRR